MVISEGKQPSPPPWTIEWLVFQGWHTVVHVGVFVVQVWLTARAVAVGPDSSHREMAILVGVGTLLGVGIEVLQISMRPDYILLDGIWDVFSDFLGAFIGWQVYRRLLQSERNPVHT